MWAAQIISLRQATMYVYNNKKGLTQAARSSPRTTQGTITGETESETWDSWKAAHETSFHSIHSAWCEFLHPSWCGHSSPWAVQDRLRLPDSQRRVSFTARHRVHSYYTNFWPVGSVSTSVNRWNMLCGLLVLCWELTYRLQLGWGP